nr:immunoglobulin light chain junction region [Macaca mulatta]MOX49293.1 immunoglobulin light chain junction region [Macaca mulatta]MOX50398.1 immunoglobulin light chain junction region [Macaca mulatta]
CHQYNTYPRTF